jgi:hypothetical protein
MQPSSCESVCWKLCFYSVYIIFVKIPLCKARQVLLLQTNTCERVHYVCLHNWHTPGMHANEPLLHDVIWIGMVNSRHTCIGRSMHTGIRATFLFVFFRTKWEPKPPGMEIGCSRSIMRHFKSFLSYLLCKQYLRHLQPNGCMCSLSTTSHEFRFTKSH